MGLFTRRVIYDGTTQQLVPNMSQQGVARFGSVVQGDTLQLEIVACRPSGNTTGAPYVPVDLANSAINVAFGTPGSTPINTVNVASNTGNVAVPTITIARVIAGVSGNANTNTNEVQSIALSNLATGGNFKLSFVTNSNVVDFGATAATMQTALNTALSPAGSAFVTKTNNYYYTCEFRGGLSNQEQSGLISVQTNGLTPMAKQVNIPLTNTAFNTLLNGNLIAETYLEIQAITDGDRNTLALEKITVYNDLIN